MLGFFGARRTVEDGALSVEEPPFEDPVAAELVAPSGGGGTALVVVAVLIPAGEVEMVEFLETHEKSKE